MKKELILQMEKEKEDGFHFVDVDKMDFANELLQEIGNLDSHIRDELVYPNLAHLFHDNHFTKDQLNDFTMRLISEDYLYFDMSNKLNYSVLKRSFTLLQLVIMVYVHNRDDIFSLESFNQLYRAFLLYFKNETILSGYDPLVGWMHSIAHSADVFSQIVKSKEIDTSMLEEIFLVIKDKFLIDSYNFISDEDERIITAMMNALNRNLLSKEFLLNYITSFEQIPEPKTFPEKYVFKNNKKNLLRSLYFRLIENEDFTYLADALKNAIIKIQYRKK